MREGDLVARLGGDDFAVLVESGDELFPLQVAERMAEAFEEPIEVADGSYFVSASIGVAASPPHEPGAVLRNAESAMYRAKALGRARIEFFDAQGAEDAAAALRRAANCAGPSSARSSSCTSSRSWTWPAGGSTAWRRWCAGTIPSVGWCHPWPSSPPPRTAA